MKKGIELIGLISILLVMFLAACSGGESSRSDSKSGSADSNVVQKESSSTASDSIKKDPIDTSDHTKKEVRNPGNQRMIIYNAEMTVVVKDFNKAQRILLSLIDQTKGYTVQSEVAKYGNNSQGGTIVARIPQADFDSFLDEVSKKVDKVKDQKITGEDVTKEYVDLESRLHAKEAVEARLNAFLKQAKDTDDLLKISDDLASVQEEMESIKGQMNYLKNHSDLSTVTIHVVEKTVRIKDKEDLNTWDKTKNAFVSSINAIATFFSAVFVLLAGYSPILVPLLIIIGICYFIYRRKKKDEK